MRIGPSYDHEAVTVANTAIGLDTDGTGTKIVTGPVESVLLTVETASIRIRYDGEDPTASTGHELLAGDSIIISGRENVTKLQMIRTGSTSATVRATYHRAA